MVVYENLFYLFQAYLKNIERVLQTHIAEKYYKIGRPEQCWDI